MGVVDVRDLIAWQKAMRFAEEVYRATRGYPAEERYGLASHTRKSAVSIPSNIAEGHGRHSPRDFARFLAIAHGSLLETETQLILAGRLGFLKEDILASVLSLGNEVGRIINGLSTSLRRPSTNQNQRPPFPDS